jgi:hypothetical protein
VHTHREVTTNRPDIIIKKRKDKMCILISMAIPLDRNIMQKEEEKKLKYKSYTQRHKNVEHEKYDYTSNNWSYQNRNRSFKENFESHTRKTFNRFTTKKQLYLEDHIIRKVLQSETREKRTVTSSSWPWWW